MATPNLKERNLHLIHGFKIKEKKLPRAGKKCDIDLVNAIGFAMTT